jgi:hypothetical protein
MLMRVSFQDLTGMVPMTPSSLLGSSARRARGSPVNSLVVRRTRVCARGSLARRVTSGAIVAGHERHDISRGFTGELFAAFGHEMTTAFVVKPR